MQNLKVKDIMTRNVFAVARDTSRQMGKPINEARGEVKTLLARAEYMLGIAPEALASERLPARPGFQLSIEHVPVGVVLDIAAWNYPLIVPVNVIVPALVAGNAVVLKHSPKTPLTGVRFERAFAQLPADAQFSADRIQLDVSGVTIAAASIRY